MTTTTIGTGGTHNYTSLAAWEADTTNFPVVLTAPVVGQCFFNGASDTEFTSASTLLTLSGHTTTGTNTITLTTGAGQSFRDNASVQTNALTYNAANGVGIRCTAAYTYAAVVDDVNVFFSNLQITNKATPGQVLNTSGSGAAFTASNCIFYGTATQMVDITGGQTFMNCLFIANLVTAVPFVNSISGGGLFYFCDFVSPSNATAVPSAAINSTYLSTGVMENCAVFGCTAVNTGSTTWTFTACMTDIASPPSGFTGGKTYASQFQNTTVSLGDWREKAGAALQGAGTPDSTHGATDIAGTARPQGGNWDIGAWELLSGGSSRVPGVLGGGVLPGMIGRGLLMPSAISAGLGWLIRRRDKLRGRS